MRFKATDDQIKQIAANAVNASRPMGMGFLHYQPEHEFKPEDFTMDKGGLYLDYVQGRMVKLYIHKDLDEWVINGEPRSDYQSWCHKYPTYESLVNSINY